MASIEKHHAASLKALQHVKELASTLEGWKHSAEKDGVQIYIKDVAGTPPMTRGDTILEAGLTLEQVGAIVQSPGARVIWDERFESAEVKERYSPREALFHSKLKGTWPVSGRDIVGAYVIEYHEGKEYITAMSSVIDPSLPEAKPYVRAELFVSGWVIRALEDGKISLIYIVHIDLKGNIPTAIVKSVQSQTPLCAGKVADYARKFGFPPYIQKVDGRIISERFDHHKTLYAVEVDAPDERGFLGDKKGSMVLEVSKKMFPEGFVVKTSIEESVHEKEEKDGNTLVVIKHIKSPVLVTIAKQ